MLGAGTTIVSIHFGFGRHMLALDQYSIMEALKWNWVTILPNYFGFYFSKISVAFFLLRLVPHRKTERFIWAVIALLSISHLWAVLAWTEAASLSTNCGDPSYREVVGISTL